MKITQPIKIRRHYNFTNLWYTFFHRSVLWPKWLQHMHFLGEISFVGFSEPIQAPWGGHLRFTYEIHDLGLVERFGLFPARFLMKILETFTRWPPGPA